MRIVITILALMLQLAATAQLLDQVTDREKRADDYFQDFAYDKAKPLYRQVYRKDTTRQDLALKIAECARHTFHYKDAEKWYLRGLKGNENADPIYFLHYAQSLTNNEKYEEAKTWFHKYAEEASHDSRSGKKIATLENIHFHFQDSQAVSFQPIRINTTEADWSPAYFGDKLVFISSRKDTEKFKNVLNWQVEDYNDLYLTHENEDGSMSDPVPFHADINSTFHEGPLVFLGEDEFIFTQNESDGADGGGHLALYHAKFDPKDFSFTFVEKLDLAPDQYSVAHPAISPDHKTLYFASNRPGGYGAADIYKALWDGTTWSNPVNMGPEINSEGSESFPFVMNEDELVFSSDGHGGLGGRDLFVVDLSHEHLEVVNLGYPYNSSKDDFGYISDATGSAGFFTSNRKNGGLDDDIYRFRVIWVAVEFLVADADTAEPISDALVGVRKNDTLVESRYTSRNGVLTMPAIPGEAYEFTISKPGYETHTYHLETSGADAGTVKELDILLERAVQVAAGPPTDTTDFAAFKKYYNRERLILTVDNQVYEYRELGDYKYLVAGEEKILLDKAVGDPSLSLKDRAMEVLTKSGYEVGESFEIKNVYFELDETDFMTRYKSELDAAVGVLKVSPRTKVEIKTFSDSRGSIAFNNELTFKRAQQVARYFMEQGISGSRFFINGYGEQGILNRCVDGVKCAEVEHAINRRAEFNVIIQ